MRVIQRYMPQLGATRCIYMLFYQSDTLPRMFATFSEEKKFLVRLVNWMCC